MVLVRQAVPDGHAGVFGQLLNDGLAVAAVLDALKHAGQHLGGVGDGLFLADLAARGVQIGRAHAKVVRGDLERAAGAGGGFLKDQRHILAAQRVVRDGKISLHAIKTNDGKQWWAAFTSFDEELKGSDKIMSTFTADIDKIFASALQEPSVEGVILNPWNRTLMLNKTLINIILGNPV